MGVKRGGGKEKAESAFERHRKKKARVWCVCACVRVGVRVVVFSLQFISDHPQRPFVGFAISTLQGRSRCCQLPCLAASHIHWRLPCPTALPGLIMCVCGAVHLQVCACCPRLNLAQAGRGCGGGESTEEGTVAHMTKPCFVARRLWCTRLTQHLKSHKQTQKQ